MRRGIAVLITVGALLLVGCGVVPGIGPDPRPVATPVAEVACHDAVDVVGGRVPEGFEAVAALRCDPYATRQLDDGLWTGLLVERLEGDLRPLLDALAVASDPRALGACSAVGYIVPDIWLVGADGTVVRTSLPSTGCGAPKDVGLGAALGRLAVTDERFEPDILIESRAALTAGCPSQANLLLLVDAAIPPSAAPPREIADAESVPYPAPELFDASRITGLRVCEYDTALAPASALAPTMAGTGAFAGVRELGAAEARAIVRAIDDAPPAGACAARATRFVVAYDVASAPTPPTETEGVSVSVSVVAPSLSLELDGCRRVIDTALRARVAAPDVVALLSP